MDHVASPGRVREDAVSGGEEEHLERLGREWDFERIVEAEAAITGLTASSWLWQWTAASL